MRKIGLVLVMFLCLGVGSLCCSDDTWARFYSDSNVSNRKTGTADSYQDDFSTAQSWNGWNMTTLPGMVDVGGTVSITFSNNIYSDDGKDGIDWFVERNVTECTPNCTTRYGFDGSGNYDIDVRSDEEGNPVGDDYSTKSLDRYSHKGSSITEWRQHDSGGLLKYIATDKSRPFIDSKTENRYVHRDYYKITFNKEGTYTFCETIHMANFPTSVACSKIIVGSNICSEWGSVNYEKSKSTEGWTVAKSGVRNNDIAEYDDWKVGETIYAKPGDVTEWYHCYYPGAQKTAQTEITTSWNVCSGTSSEEVISRAKRWWNNRFDVTQVGMLSSNSFNSESFDWDEENNLWKTDATIRSWGNSYQVESGKRSRAGMTLSETITAARPYHVLIKNENDSDSCPVACESDEEAGCTEERTLDVTNGYVNENGYEEGESYKSISKVEVPYNYNNSITVSIKKNKEEKVYAGETVTIESADVTVGKKKNYKTKTSDTNYAEYATRVNGAEIRLVSYISDDDRTGNKNKVNDPEDGFGSYSTKLCSAISSYGDCAEIAVDEGTTNERDGCDHALNCNENTNGVTEQKFAGKKYNVFDARAGLWLCVVAAVYPANSGSDTNMDGEVGEAGNGKWHFSAPDCVQIAKRPSLQVWGGSLYTAGNVFTSVAEKRVVVGYRDFGAGYNGDQANSATNTTVFGSWVEQSILVNGLISGLASGASTGYGNPGGSFEGDKVDFCLYRSPLTIPNSNIPGGLPGIKRCVGDSAGNTTSNKMNEPTDKSALIQNFMGESDNYTYRTKYNALGNFIDDYDGDGIVKDNDGGIITMGNRHTYVLHAKKEDSTVDFTIDQDIKYENGEYEDLFDIPKLIIYANNINIECDVKRIDAVLIADNAVNTCSNANEGDVNSPERSNQLKINGAVIADWMITPRTYGAGTGAASVVSAEIVDYDTSLYLWGSQKAAASNSGKLGTAYQTELPPRY